MHMARLMSNLETETKFVYVKLYVDVQYCSVKKPDNRSIKAHKFSLLRRRPSYGGLILIIFCHQLGEIE